MCILWPTHGQLCLIGVLVAGAQDAAAQAMARAAEGMQQAAPETASQLRSASEAVSPASAFQLTFSAHRGTGLAARPAEEAASALEVLGPCMRKSA